MKGANFWRLYGWINRGKQRREVIKYIPDKPITAEELRKEINSKTELKLSLREMSRHLTSFADKGLMECLTPDEPYGRLYIITSPGKKVKLKLQGNVV